MFEQELLDSMTPKELNDYMWLLEECSVIIEKEYLKERRMYERLDRNK